MTHGLTSVFGVFVKISCVCFGLLGAVSFCVARMRSQSRRWMNLSVAVREYGYWLGLMNLMLVVFAILSKNPTSKAPGTLNLVSGILMFLPAFQATRISEDLPRRITTSFGGGAEPSGNAPFDFMRLFSSVLRESHSVDVETHVYSRISGKDLKLDFYSDSNVAPESPCVVVLAGGSWQRSDRKRFSALNFHLARCGYRVAVVEYRTAPGFRFPNALDDVRSALEYLKENAEALRLDPDRFVLLGRSAGAQLALLEAYTNFGSCISGVISFYGAIDLPHAYANPPDKAVVDVRNLLEDYLGGTPKSSPEIYREASPIYSVNSSAPPTLLLHGDRDEMVPCMQSERLASRLKELSVHNLLVRLPWATHGFDHNLYGPGGQISTYAVETFLSAVTRKVR